MNEIKYLFNYKDIFILEEKYKDLIKKKNINFNKIDSLNIDYRIYEEAIKIISNKFLSSINVEDIIILDFRLDEKYYIKDNKKLELSDDERKLVDNINKHLDKIIDIFFRVLPGINIERLDSGLYISDIDERKIEIEKKILKDINNIIKDFNATKTLIMKKSILVI